MEDIELKSCCISGSFKKVNVICNETPFSLSYDGRILYNGEIFLTRTHTNVFGSITERPWPREFGEILVKALNDTYKNGYEKDRIEWITVS